jgi:hypothetical protein
MPITTKPKIDLLSIILFTVFPNVEKLVIYGTGSYPPSKKGLHLRTLFTERYIPLNTPYFSNASIEYCEHVG